MSLRGHSRGHRGVAPLPVGALLTVPLDSIRCVEHAFYEPCGPGTFVSMPATAGPWFPDAQHGGPPSALAARAIELHEPDERQRLGRVAIDILRPIPVGPLSVRTRTVRPGRRITLIEAVLEADGQEVLHARGWRIERPAGKVPEIAEGDVPPPVPGDGDGSLPLIFQMEETGYLASIEWRFLPAGSGWVDVSAAGEASSRTTVTERPGVPGTTDFPATAQVRSAWTRSRFPLVAGEEPSPMQRTLLVADSGSGVSAALPPTEFIFVNVDLTVTLARDPESDWMLLEAATTIGADGTGMALTRLSDPVGACGRGLQTLLVAPR
jgi:Acyl-CoA thioesterase N-terminal domain/Acyl-CoA thioesterase C-terminal domain